MLLALRPLALVLLLLPLFGLAQSTATITGTALSSNGAPVAGANIVVDGSQIGTATGGDGSYAIAGLPAGTYILTASAVGHRTESRRLSVGPGAHARADFVLHIVTTDLGEVIVTARETLTGGPGGIRDLPGSGHYVGAERLRSYADGDVMRALREVPGVDIQEEEGYGLRPNIGLRGTGSNRSSKITLMEDGVLIAPAPYAAPAAYYFPTVGRMSGIEVRKGASQIKYGPYTTGGALNLISTPIPSEFSGFVEAFVGQNRARNAHVHVGNSFRHVGFLIETYQSNVAGFKEIFPLEDLATGFGKQDYLAKLRLNTSPSAPIYQSLTLKMTRTDEVSHETYLGLTEDDFRATPLRRYAGSQVDRLDAQHAQLQLRHVAVLSANADVTTTAYRNTFARNWYKLDAVRAPDASKVGVGSILARPSEFAPELELLRGALGDDGTLRDGRLFAKANNREYVSTGVQTILGIGLDIGSSRTDLEIGLRLHRDEMDRFQWEDQYAMDSGRMNRVLAGEPGRESNRIERGEAVAAFAQAQIGFGRLSFTPGLRFEHITLSRDDFGKNDPGRTGIDLTVVSNTVDVWIPGLSLSYDVSGDVRAFAGLHRGFAPPTAQEGVRPEESTNYELGLRYDTAILAAQATAFFNHYDNLLGSDLAAGGGTGSTDQFNGGEVHVLGLELSGSADLAAATGLPGIRLPVRFAYTFTEATFRSRFESTFGPWGSVDIGDALPYVARHQAAGSLGIEWNRYSLDARASYIGDRRTTAGQGSLPSSEKLAAQLIVDLAAEAGIDGRTSLFGTLRNVLDQTYVASRLPAGLRPGLPRTFILGMRTSF